jgi:hypothetical protein
MFKTFNFIEFKFKKFIFLPVIILILLSNTHSKASIGNNMSQNQAQYGEPISLENFPTTGTLFNGYITYSFDTNWKIVAFYKKGLVRSEHLVPKNDKNFPILSRDDVRNRALKMFPQHLRGAYHLNKKAPRAEGYFFDRGLIIYEYMIEGRTNKGYRGVKVLLYEDDKRYRQINNKAFL